MNGRSRGSQGAGEVKMVDMDCRSRAGNEFDEKEVAIKLTLVTLKTNVECLKTLFLIP